MYKHALLLPGKCIEKKAERSGQDQRQQFLCEDPVPFGCQVNPVCGDKFKAVTAGFLVQILLQRHERKLMAAGAGGNDFGHRKIAPFYEKAFVPLIKHLLAGKRNR